MSPTEEQRIAALKIANRHRFAKSEVRRKLKAGEIHPGYALTDAKYLRAHLSGEEIQMLLRMDLYDALTRCHRLGPGKARAIILRTKLSPYIKVGAVKNGERAALRRELEDRAIWQTWSKLLEEEK